jgi:hypothetical protein
MREVRFVATVGATMAHGLAPRRGEEGLAGLGIICPVCEGELQDMTGMGEQPWALCRCDGVQWDQQPDRSYQRVELDASSAEQ